MDTSSLQKPLIPARAMGHEMDDWEKADWEKADWEKAQRVLVEIVGNAAYDVRRWPGHVVLVLATRNSIGFNNLTATIEQNVRSRRDRVIRTVVALVIACMAPYLVMSSRVPSMCPFTSHLSETVQITHAWTERVQKTLQVVKEHECDKVILPWLTVFTPALSGIGLVFFGALLDWLGYVLTLYFTDSPRRYVHGLVVRFVVLVFSPVRLKLIKVTMNYVHKPRPCPKLTLRSILHYVWRAPLLTAVIFYAIEIQLVVQGFHIGSPNYALILAIFAYSSYFRVMSLILGAKSALARIIQTELQHCLLTEFGTEDKSDWTTEQKCLINSSDVWWRLFREHSSTFALNLAELKLIVEYFRLSQEKCQYPVTWHDRHCITGNTPVRALYLNDVNVLLHGRNNTEIDEVRQLYAEVCKLYKEQEKACAATY